MSDTPTNSLDEILLQFADDLTDVQHIKLRQALEAYIEKEIIGDDEPETVTNVYDGIERGLAPTRHQNQLRAAQRAKLGVTE